MASISCSLCGGKLTRYRGRRTQCTRCSAVHLASGEAARRDGEPLFVVPDLNPFGQGRDRLFTIGEVAVALAPYGWLFIRTMAMVHPASHPDWGS